MNLFKLLIVFIIMVLTLPVPAADYYEAGKKAFSENKYETALRYFKKNLKNNPNHLKCRYYYAQTLLALKELQKAQAQYEKIIELSPISYEARLAALGIAKIERYRLISKGIEVNTGNKNLNTKRKLEILSAGDNYIENALDGGKVTRWNTGKMPIKLYIEKNDLYFSEVRRAMEAWISKVENSPLSYKLVDTPEQANIRVLFVDEIFKKTGKAMITGLATPYIKGHILEYYEIKLIPYDMIFATALHEFGHALGIQGHSSNENDIMYAETNQKTTLSRRDINTISLLYTLDPDISNFEEGEGPLEKSSKNEKLLGSKDKLLDKKMKEAVEYTEKYPNNALSWGHLGKAYFNREKYDEAIISFKKAIEIDPTYTNAIESLAFTYKELGRFEDAEREFARLVSMQPDNIAFSHNYAYYLMENKRYGEAEKVLQQLISTNPKAVSDENIIKLMDYLKKR